MVQRTTPRHAYLMLWQNVYGHFIVKFRSELSPRRELLPLTYDEMLTYTYARLEAIVKEQVELCFPDV